MPFYFNSGDKNINFYDPTNIKYFRNFIVSVFMQYTGRTNIEEHCRKYFHLVTKIWIFFLVTTTCWWKITLTWRIRMGVNYSVNVTKDISKDNKSCNNNKSTNWTKFMSTLGNDSSDVGCRWWNLSIWSWTLGQFSLTR